MGRNARLEDLLATFLRWGSWLASAVVGLGFALGQLTSHAPMQNLTFLPSMRIATAGIALFILLPILRVLLMFFVFIRERDFRFASIAGLVLAIILLAIILGFPATSNTFG